MLMAWSFIYRLSFPNAIFRLFQMRALDVSGLKHSLADTDSIQSKQSLTRAKSIFAVLNSP
jgi:hypothetical protein